MNDFRLRRCTALALIAFAVLLAACSSQHSAAGRDGSKPTTTLVTGGVVGTVESTKPPTRPAAKKPTQKVRRTKTIPKKVAPATTTTHAPVSRTTVPTTYRPGPCSPGFVCGHVTAIGDSVMLDAAPDLQADIPGIDVEAEVSRQWDEGVELVQELKADRTLGSIVVIDLGTNGPVDPDQFEQMMSALAGASVVVFVTVHLPSYYSWSESVNATLEQGVPMYHSARLADFNALADENPEWFGSDGVHMPIGGTGAQAMARLIADTA
jgi:hypothetical protein